MPRGQESSAGRERAARELQRLLGAAVREQDARDRFLQAGFGLGIVLQVSGREIVDGVVHRVDDAVVLGSAAQRVRARQGIFHEGGDLLRPMLAGERLRLSALRAAGARQGIASIGEARDGSGDERRDREQQRRGERTVA